MSSPVYIISRLRLDAQLWQPAPSRQSKQMGRPRIIGPRLPSLKPILDDLDTCWETAILADWYGQSDYPLEFTSNTAVWYKTGMPPVPIRWVLVRAAQGQHQSQALLCTDLDITPLEILDNPGRWRLLLRRLGHVLAFKLRSSGPIKPYFAPLRLC